MTFFKWYNRSFWLRNRYKLGARKRRRLQGENHSPIVPSVEPEAGPSSRQDDDLKRKISAPSKVGTRDGLQPDSSRVTLEYVRGLFWILQYYYQVLSITYIEILSTNHVENQYLFKGCPVVGLVLSLSPLPC